MVHHVALHATQSPEGQMRTTSHLLLLASAVLTLVACGGDQVNSSPGTSSNTLLVQASVTSSPTLGIQNSKTGDQFQTDITVRVWRVIPGSPNVALAGAVVKAKIGNSEYVIPAGNRPELYRYSVPGGANDLLVTLNVDAGVDFVHNVQRRAPGIQVFTNPLPGQSVSIAGLAGQPFHVTWTRPSAADIAQLRVSQYDQQVADTGSNDIPVANIQQGDAQECSLDRTNSVQILSSAGSQLDVTVRQSLSINVVP